MMHGMHYIDCFDGIPQLPDQSINLVVTSPPYAEQRKHQYGGIPEKEYPDWTVAWCSLLKPKLAPDASVCIVIRTILRDGVLSDFVYRTMLALFADGWMEPEELMWYKPTSPPLGSVNRPRRAWEAVKWVSLTNRPKCYPKANGTPSKRIGLEQAKHPEGGDSFIHKGQNKAKSGIARCTDVVIAGTHQIEKGYNHSAMYPPEVPEYCINLLTDPGDLVLDPFAGSGTTLRVAKLLRRKAIGFEIEPPKGED